MKVPALAVDVVVKVTVLLNGGVPDEGLNAALIPLGVGSCQEPPKLTDSAEPTTMLSETVDVALSPRIIATLVGDALNVKLKVTLFIVSVMSVVLVTDPPCAVTR